MKVEPLKVTTPSDKEVKLSRVFHAPRALVFRALTEPELLKQWLYGPGWSLPHCEVDPKPGGAFRYVWRKTTEGSPEGSEPEVMEMSMTGTFREIQPPGRIVHTELFDDDWTGGETIVTTLLDEHDGKTTMTMTVLYSSKEARDGALRSGMDEFLNVSYEVLDGVLARAA
jgi:uncharacterized protein YndB with AHSA1/START domain